MDRRPELRRAMTLKEQLSTPAEPAIRDLLRVPHDDDDDGGGAEDRPCTLMDAIDRDVRGEGRAGGAINWRPLRHRLWVRRAAGAWHATGSTTKPPLAVASRASPRRRNKYHLSPGEGSVAVAFTRAPSQRAAVDDDEDGDVEEEDEHNDEPPAAASTSLMALLEQTDIHLEADEDGGASQCGTIDEDGRGEGQREKEEEEEEELQVCCVCMVRHKGAAFIPCGHTFCRLCSRELRHTRGNCPLCNVFIQDILHIF
ncbi:hypothetical protein ACQJBY_029304 [Aegilops geniculata]